jgi:hypothetical protein
VARLIPAWIHPQAARGGKLVMRVAARPITRVPQQRFARRVSQVPISGGQGMATVNAQGQATVSVGPQGRGTTWYPAAAFVTTTTGAADNSTVSVYVGAQVQENLQGGQSYAGGGDTVSLAVVSMQPGDYLIAVWSGAVPGAVATLNVTGSQDVLAY